jgi:hypothetical protein
MSVEWTITAPSVPGAFPLSDYGLSVPQVAFKAMGVSTARMAATRHYDSEEAWWAYDQLVTIYRDGAPYFTGRVGENPDSADASTEGRMLFLSDAWADLQEVIYREPWGVGSGSFLYPRCVLGMNAAGERIDNGAQIGEVIDYLITQGAAIQKGDIADGFTLWPSEARNADCESIILGELQFNPDWLAWLDHTTVPPTFHALPKADLDPLTIDIADENVASHEFAEVKRTVPLGVSIIYDSAATIDGEVFRQSYVDEAGVTTGRRVIRAMIDLEGMDVQYQKSRVETRTLPTNAATMTAWMKLKYPELLDVPDGAFDWSGTELALAPEGAQPDPVNPKAQRIAKESASDLPRELVRGAIEDWMRVKVGRVMVKWKLKATNAATDENKKLMDPFLTFRDGMVEADEKPKLISVTATSAVTKLYKGVSSFTAGEGRPEGLAAAIFAAATEQQWEGGVTTVDIDVPAESHVGKRLTLVDGETTLLEGAVIHAASADIEEGALSVSFGPMPYLSAGDFLDLQRILNRRQVRWFSTEERTSNTLGAPTSGSSKGDNVGPFDQPDTITPPGGSGGETLLRQWKASPGAEALTIDCKGGTLTSQAGFAPVTVADVTALSATASGHVILTVSRDSSTRAVTGTPAISYAAGTLSESDYTAQIIPLAKVTVEDEAITDILPLKFEELHIFESLAKVNGESKLVDLLMAGRNIYDPPPP